MAGNLFVGALKDEMLVRLELDGDRVVNEERMLRGKIGAFATCVWGQTDFCIC